MLNKIREYLSDWQERGFDQRPVWYDAELDERINALTNVELLELIDLLSEDKP